MRKTWAFFYMAPNCHPNDQRATIISDNRRTLIYGVSNVEAACVLAKKLVEEDGCILIELCGAFQAEDARKVIHAVEGKVSVGYMTFFEDNLDKIHLIKD